MGAVLAIHHLAVIPPGFFNVLAQRSHHLLHYTPTSVEDQLSNRASVNLSLIQSDDEALAREINIRQFVRDQSPSERKLPIASIESFNSIAAQNYFAVAAINAGVAGRKVRRTLQRHFAGEGEKIEEQDKTTLAEKLGAFAALPKTRIRMPSGTQHLVADEPESLLKQMSYHNGSLLQVELCAYAPKAADLAFPNAQGTKLDRTDALAQGGIVTTYLQRELVEAQQEASLSLSFGHILALNRQRGMQILGDLSHAHMLPKTELTTHGGAHYLVSNSPAAMDWALHQHNDKFRVFVDAGPRRVLL